MLKHRSLFVLVVFFVSSCQMHARAFTYNLRRPQQGWTFSTLHTMPDGDLLVLTKRFEQPKQIWTLRRIAAWDRSQPREEEMDVNVGPNDEPLDWALQADRWNRNDQLLMDPHGNYLVVRLSQNADMWKYDGKSANPPPQSVLNIIDLHNFKLLRRVVVTEPFLAAGDMGFSPTGVLVVTGLQELEIATIDGKATRTGHYAVQTLSIPGLKPETVCTYTLVKKLYLAESASTPEEKACGPKLAPIGFSSLDDVRRSLNFFGRGEYSANFWGRVPEQSPWGCQFSDMSQNLEYELFDCDESRVELTFFFWYRGFRVFRLADGTQVMDLKLPHRPQFSGVLATSGGVTYMVLLRNGARLEGYRVP
jgi:hypothetical protein